MTTLEAVIAGFGAASLGALAEITSYFGSDHFLGVILALEQQSLSNTSLLLHYRQDSWPYCIIAAP
jgi:hypothetical protein